MRRNDDAFSQYSAALTFETLADEVLSPEIGKSELNRPLVILGASPLLIALAVFRKMSDAEPDEALTIIFGTQFEIADDFTEDVFEMVLVVAHGI